MPRKHRPFSLSKRGNIYYFSVWDEEQKKYLSARSTGETNKVQAAIVAARMIEENYVPVKGLPLAIDYIIDRIQTSQNSAKYILEGVRYLNKYCKNTPEFSRLKISDVQNKHLNKLVDYLKSQNLTPRTINRIINYIKPALKAAFMRGYIAKDPTAGQIERLPESHNKRGSLSADEIRQILAMPPLRDLRFKPYMVIAILTGMRKGELRALRWMDVEKDVIRIRQSFTDTGGITSPKTEESAREIPVLKPVRDVLTDLKQNSPYAERDDFVFYQANRGTPCPAHFTDKAFNAVLDAIGIDDIERTRRHLVPHSTRHSFVTFCRTLLPDFIVGGMSGHTTAQMIDNYGRPTAEHFRTAREVLDAALSIKPDKDGSVH